MAVLMHASVSVQEGVADALYLDDRLIASFMNRPSGELFRSVADAFNSGQVTVMMQMEAKLQGPYAKIPSSLNLLRMGIPQPD